MNILFYTPVFELEEWLPFLEKSLPQAKIHLWQEDGENPPADYALVWRPKPQMLSHRTDLKAIFVLGAGVDAILEQLEVTPDLLPKDVPLYRLQDTGMAIQMQEYTIAAVMRYFRQLDEYQQLQRKCEWGYLTPYEYEDFTIGVMGLGILGSQVATKLASLGFKVKGWSRTQKSIDQVECYSESQLDNFLSDVKLLINLVPSTPNTRGILNKSLFAKLQKQAYLINIARGRHLVEADLIEALESGQIKAATLDVFGKEPLAKDHPFWLREEITITPHIAAITKPEHATKQIVEKINQIEQGKRVTEGLIDLTKGY